MEQFETTIDDKSITIRNKPKAILIEHAAKCMVKEMSQHDLKCHAVSNIINLYSELEIDNVLRDIKENLAREKYDEFINEVESLSGM